MANKLYDEASVSDIADAIREKNGTQTQYKVSEMGDAVRSIPTGKPEQTKSASYTANGTYDITPDSGYAMSKATVTVAIPYYEGW